jgi:hypothetical protein
MKLIIREYLSSLRERGELDAILPDLLSQLGLNVYSRPRRGTRQDGVDVGAVGSFDGGEEKVYLFTIKPGDLSRKEWDGDSIQSLRPSLNEILDSYIPNRIPEEHRAKPVVICIAIGGDVHEQVRPQLKGFTKQRTTKQIEFEEWNGDKIASLIQTSFLREDLLPADARSHLRKALALLDEPEASCRHFVSLIKSLSADIKKDSERLRALRQIAICLWMLFAWARENGNMEAAYISSESAVLHSWELLKDQRETAIGGAMTEAFASLIQAYQQTCSHYLHRILPHVGKLHGVSSSIRPSCSIDVNLKLFDLLGRMALDGIWAYWGFLRCPEDETVLKDQMLDEAKMYSSAVKSLISNNPSLMLPAKDDQSTDISLALLLLIFDENNHADIKTWLHEIVQRAKFSYDTHGRYPCTLRSYTDLLSHPKKGDIDYRKEVTTGSVLYPTIAVYSALLADSDTYQYIARFRKQELQHCNFQLWYPDDQSEKHIYINSELHGAALSDLDISDDSREFLRQVFRECEQMFYFDQLSAVRLGWWPLVLLACRHYRLPVPVHLLREINFQLRSGSVQPKTPT